MTVETNSLTLLLTHSLAQTNLQVKNIILYRTFVDTKVAQTGNAAVKDAMQGVIERQQSPSETSDDGGKYASTVCPKVSGVLSSLAGRQRLSTAVNGPQQLTTLFVPIRDCVCPHNAST